MVDFFTSVSTREAMRMVDKAVLGSSLTGKKRDEYVSDNGRGEMVAVMVFEKYYIRAENQLTVTVTIDNLRGNTHIRAAGGGGGQGLFRFDWGASESFEDCIKSAFREYLIM